MATKADIRRIALSFSETEESKDDFAFSVWNKGKLKAFLWVWKERVDPKKPRVPNHAVMAIRTVNVGQRDALIAAEPKKFFTEPHYNGFPAVLVRLDAVTVADLKVLIADAWTSMAPPDLVKRGRK
ncbi:MAG TPA: hypothetical protein VJN70_02405 [Gemmatimonadaceae bacterium]|nr:hypothetical protein [Gemmatimonadaceae bacterium]